MIGFYYSGGEFYADDLKIKDLAKTIGTPFYCYSASLIEHRFKHFQAHLPKNRTLICYALKANSNQAIIKTLGRLGAGADVVSEGELRRALTANIPPDRIVFAGVGKQKNEITFALQNNIYQFNVESVEELKVLNQIAEELKIKAKIALRINPNVDALTHGKITTGKSENKFGINIDQAFEVYNYAKQLSWIDIKGVAVHIGSQLIDWQPFYQSFQKIAQLVKELKKNNFPISRIDLGGGIGIDYHLDQLPNISEYCSIVEKTVGYLDCDLIFEPGRSLCADSGILVSKTIYVKKGSDRSFVIIDAAMNDFIRPTLYDAWHNIQPVKEPLKDEKFYTYDIVGPVCETGDTFALQRHLPYISNEDLLVIRSTGAYGAVMSSNYNTRLNAPEIMVYKNQYKIIRERTNYHDLIMLDQLPDWLE
ncbi:MAG: diaminopimelate decarboxylase [Alphaproteobacteria bacterium]|nr:diaminopimelate decarboxylase [Alphaproteobacteria bacterium]